MTALLVSGLVKSFPGTDMGKDVQAVDTINLSVEQGQMGNGSSSLSLSRTGIRRSPSRGLPASRRYSPRQAEFRPRSRAVQRLSAAEFQVRLFSSLQLVVAPPACEPGQDTPAIFFRVLTAWLRDSRRF